MTRRHSFRDSSDVDPKLPIRSIDYTALTEPGARFDDPAPPVGVLSVQLAFRVERDEVDSCAATQMASRWEIHAEI